MNFFGVEISDAQFDAAMTAAREALVFAYEEDGEAEIEKALGFETGDVTAPPAESDSRKTTVLKSDINHVS